MNGSHYSPLTLPVVASLPAAPAFTVGTQDVTVGGGQTLTLSAGEYDRFLAHNDSTITFSGGVYTFSRWDVRVRVTLYFAAPAEIRIAERMDTDQNTFIGPAPASGLTARDIRIVVAGSNGNSGSLGDSPKAAEIGRNNTIVANVYAPNGTLFIRTDTDATGAFIAKWLHVGQRVGLTLESGF